MSEEGSGSKMSKDSNARETQVSDRCPDLGERVLDELRGIHADLGCLDNSVNVSVDIQPKHVLDLVAATLTAGLLSPAEKKTPKIAAEVFFQTREQIVKLMTNHEADELPLFLANVRYRQR